MVDKVESITKQPTPNATKKALDDLQKEVDERGLQPKSATPEPRKKPTPTPHGSLNPTDGRSGKTSKVGT